MTAKLDKESKEIPSFVPCIMLTNYEFPFGNEVKIFFQKTGQTVSQTILEIG
jgi:hypothetical protein